MRADTVAIGELFATRTCERTRSMWSAVRERQKSIMFSASRTHHIGAWIRGISDRSAPRIIDSAMGAKRRTVSMVGCPFERKGVVRHETAKRLQLEGERQPHVLGERCAPQRLKLLPQDVRLLSETSRFGAKVSESLVAGHRKG